MVTACLPPTPPPSLTAHTLPGPSLGAHLFCASDVAVLGSGPLCPRPLGGK